SLSASSRSAVTSDATPLHGPARPGAGCGTSGRGRYRVSEPALAGSRRPRRRCHHAGGHATTVTAPVAAPPLSLPRWWPRHRRHRADGRPAAVASVLVAVLGSA